MLDLFQLSPARLSEGVKQVVQRTKFADSDELTERLVVYEIHTPSGNWSSFPPHRHDTRDHSSYHEETYYYRFLPENGFAIQRIYTRDTDLDVAIPVQHGDVVLIHEGYHPVVKAPGTNAYYLNFLAGDVRKDFGGQRSFLRLGEQELGRQSHFNSTKELTSIL